ncbi:MAG: multiheme c-type cytochrome [Planctomycetota bacterium]|jgi:hypothetical protein
MTSWKWILGMAALPAMLYMACQADSQSGAPVTLISEAEAIEEVLPQAPQEEEKESAAPQEESVLVQDPVVEEAEKPVEIPGVQENTEFASNAFPPTVSDAEYHEDAWYKDDCLRCHETGVEDATIVKHENMPSILLVAKCRSCHVLIPGKAPVERKPRSEDDLFARNAFPPMIPASASHREAWLDDNCLLCHETGNRGAPIVKHEGMPLILLEAKCRSCHVQVRSAGVPGR